MKKKRMKIKNNNPFIKDFVEENSFLIEPSMNSEGDVIEGEDATRHFSQREDIEILENLAAAINIKENCSFVHDEIDTEPHKNWDNFKTIFNLKNH
jgi:hypothetical protein